MEFVRRRGVSYSLFIIVDTQLHTGDTRLHAQKPTSRTQITHGQPAPGLKVRPRLDYAVSNSPRDVAFPVCTETTINITPDIIPVKRAVKPPFPPESARQLLGGGG